MRTAELPPALIVLPSISSHRFVGGPEGAEKPRRLDASLYVYMYMRFNLVSRWSRWFRLSTTKRPQIAAGEACAARDACNGEEDYVWPRYTRRTERETIEI